MFVLFVLVAGSLTYWMRKTGFGKTPKPRDAEAARDDEFDNGSDSNSGGNNETASDGKSTKLLDPKKHKAYVPADSASPMPAAEQQARAEQVPEETDERETVSQPITTGTKEEQVAAAINLGDGDADYHE